MQGFEAFEQRYSWLTKPLHQLTTLYQQQQLAHALLVTGSAGVGKWPLARQLARVLLCKHLTEQQPCGHCKSCLLDQAGNHADSLFLQPEGQTLGVDEIRRLTEFTQGKAQQSGNKVIIIQHVERMTEAAANALLKTLEEPPANCFLLLCSQEPQRLKATILSRCQRWSLPAMTPQQLNDFLANYQQRDIPDYIWALSGGAPLKALTLMESTMRESIAHLLAQIALVFKAKVVIGSLVKQIEDQADAALLLGYSLQRYLQQHPDLDPQRVIRLQAALFAYCRDAQQILGQNKALMLTSLFSEWQRLSSPSSRP